MYACVGVNKRMYARTKTHATHTCERTEKALSREKHAPCVSRVEIRREKETRLELQKSWPRTKVTICIDRSISPIGRPVVHLPRDPTLPWILIRWTGDGGYLFRCMLTLRQPTALYGAELEPSVVTVRHHRAKTEKRCNTKGLGVTCVISCEGSGQ